MLVRDMSRVSTFGLFNFGDYIAISNAFSFLSLQLVYNAIMLVAFPKISSISAIEQILPSASKPDKSVH